MVWLPAEEGRVQPPASEVASELVTKVKCSVLSAMAAGEPGAGKLSRMSGMSSITRSGVKRKHCSAAFMKHVLPAGQFRSQLSEELQVHCQGWACSRAQAYGVRTGPTCRWGRL